ncbi:DsbA family oxidoreductase [Glycomyces sp. NPDC047010]|uniref:DsbA family oxidoreductase n=1 Tax=Glycomyces sp. NPDC047010 TaxID=3155023 RepID=UPI0033EE1F33
MTLQTAPEAATRLTIDVWADVLCPWCYLGEHRLQAAVAASPHAAAIDVRVHTFELAPDAAAEVVPTLDYLAAKYGVSAAQARAMEQRMADQAASEGLPYEVDRPARNSGDLLRLVHLAAEHGRAWEFLRAAQTEVFTGNFAAFETATLVGIGGRLGIPEAEVRDVLDSDRYADTVRADHAEAVRLGARGVPFTVLGQRLGIPGAVSVEEYTAAIAQAWDQTHG